MYLLDPTLIGPAALRRLTQGSFLDMDSVFLEFILHAGAALESWFCDFLTPCMSQLKIPKIWKRALIVASLEARKATGGPKELPYRSIAPLCYSFKFLRLIYTRVESIIDSLLPQKQGGFGHESERRPGHPADIGHRG